MQKLVKQENLERSVKENIDLNYNSGPRYLQKKLPSKKGVLLNALALTTFTTRSGSIPVMFPVGKLEVTQFGFRQIADLFSMN